MSEDSTEPDAAESFAGYAMPPGAYAARPQRGRNTLSPLALDRRNRPGHDGAERRVAADQPCAEQLRVPTGLRRPRPDSVATNPRFVAADGSFSVSYPSAGATYDVTRMTPV